MKILVGIVTPLQPPPQNLTPALGFLGLDLRPFGPQYIVPSTPEPPPHRCLATGLNTVSVDQPTLSDHSQIVGVLAARLPHSHTGTRQD